MPNPRCDAALPSRMACTRPGCRSHESPLAACLREVREELALKRKATVFVCGVRIDRRGHTSVSTSVFFGGSCQRLNCRRSESTVRNRGILIVSHAEAMASPTRPDVYALALRAFRQADGYAEDGTEVRTRHHNPRRLIRAEYPTEHAASEAIHEAAFGRKLEADVVRRLHQSGDVAVLSLVAERAGRVVGHAMFSYAGLEGPMGPSVEWCYSHRWPCNRGCRDAG